MIDFLNILLWPVIKAMDLIFQAFNSLTGSAGLSVILLSISVALLSYPLRAWAQKAEKRISVRKQLVDAETAKVAGDLKGEERFRAMEKVFEAHGYHPIQSIALGLPFFVMLPFLLSALLLFADYPALKGVSFLMIPDLSQPDGLLGGLHLLPFLMTGITILDSWIRFRDDRRAFIRFLVIAAILFALVYNFNAAIVLYWTISNIIAILTFLARRTQNAEAEAA